MGWRQRVKQFNTEGAEATEAGRVREVRGFWRAVVNKVANRCDLP